MLRPFKTVWDKSFTKAWSYVQMVPGVIALGISEVSSFVSDPTFRSYLDQMDLPKWVSVSLIVLGLVTYVAHGHKDD